MYQRINFSFTIQQLNGDVEISKARTPFARPIVRV
jgi:hypothetical protein